MNDLQKLYEEAEIDYNKKSKQYQYYIGLEDHQENYIYEKIKKIKREKIK